MKTIPKLKSKPFISITAFVVGSALAVAVSVWATSVGTNVSVTGNLSVNGTTGTSTIASGGGFTVGASQLVIQQTSGNVGIGTTSPFATLSVNAAAGATSFAIGSSTATSFIVDSNGNVGIGTTTPDSNLEVRGTSMRFLGTANYPLFDITSPGLGSTNSNTEMRFTSGYESNTTYTTQIFNTVTQASSTSVTVVWNNMKLNGNTVRASAAFFGWDSDKHVAVFCRGGWINGTNLGKFTIDGRCGPAGGETDDVPLLIIRDRSMGGGVNSGYVSNFTEWQDSSMNAMSVVDRFGRFGIGTTTSYAALSVKSGAAATTTLAIVPISNQTANVLDIYNTSGVLTSVYTAGGSLGIGTTSPAKTFATAGDGFFGSSATTTVFIHSTGSNKGGCLELTGTNGAKFRAYATTTGPLILESGTCQ